MRFFCFFFLFLGSFCYAEEDSCILFKNILACDFVAIKGAEKKSVDDCIDYLLSAKPSVRFLSKSPKLNYVFLSKQDSTQTYRNLHRGKSIDITNLGVVFLSGTTGRIILPSKYNDMITRFDERIEHARKLYVPREKDSDVLVFFTDYAKNVRKVILSRTLGEDQNTKILTDDESRLFWENVVKTIAPCRELEQKPKGSGVCMVAILVSNGAYVRCQDVYFSSSDFKTLVLPRPQTDGTCKWEYYEFIDPKWLQSLFDEK